MTTKEQTRYKVVQSDGSERLMTAEELCTKPLVHPAETQGKLAAFDDLVAACEAILPYLSTESELLDYAATNDGQASGYDVASKKLRAALAKARP